MLEMADENADDGSDTSSLTFEEVTPEDLETNKLGESKVTPPETMKEFQLLLDGLLLSTSVTEDIQILERVHELATKYTPIKIKLGDCQETFFRILNPTSLKRSRDDDSLQDILLKLVDVITQDDEMARKVIQNYNYIIPFLVECLSSKDLENSDYASFLVRGLAALDSGFSREIGESGAVTSMIHNIENRELIVSNVADTPRMKKGLMRVYVEEMLQTLEILSKHEEAIVKMEENGILKCLFEILGEDVGERAKGYCVAIIHTMCHTSSEINMRRQIEDVENALETLEDLVHTGTETTRAKVNELRSKLQEWEDEESS